MVEEGVDAKQDFHVQMAGTKGLRHMWMIKHVYIDIHQLQRKKTIETSYTTNPRSMMQHFVEGSVVDKSLGVQQWQQCIYLSEFLDLKFSFDELEDCICIL